METFVVCVLIVLSFSFLVWEVHSIGRDIAAKIEAAIETVTEDIEDEEIDEVELASMLGESDGVPVIIGLVRRRNSEEHPEITCGICNNSQCASCQGAECENCGMVIETPVET